MKLTSSKLPLMAISLLLLGCNEKVSPELQNSNTVGTTSGSGGGSTSGSGSGSGSGAPSSYSFKVINTSDPFLGYQLHRTGEAHKNSPCEIKRTDGNNFDNDTFSADFGLLDHDQKTYDISCFFEAEELSLFHSGFKFKVEASPNACEFVAYEPFSFFSDIPGDSSTNYTQITCAENISSAQAQGYGPTIGLDAQYGAGSYAACNRYLDVNLAPASRLPRSVASDAALCAFDYSQRTYPGGETGPNCDVGEIVVNPISLTRVDPADPTSAIMHVYESPKVIKCGGKVSNCVGGPIKSATSGDDATYLSQIYSTVLDQKFTYEQDYSGLKTGKRSSNRGYVNYRRNLASPYIDFGDATPGGVSWNAYLSSFAPSAFNGNGRKYDPNLMSFYSYNSRMDDLTPLIDSTAIAARTIVNGYTAEPYASEPFQSVHPGYPINPFYTFLCLDKAYDVKARIRMVVRDWDRIIVPSENRLEYVSDINESNARQDNRFRDALNPYNDVFDWDDYLIMTRSPGSFDPLNPGVIEWRNPYQFLSIIFPRGQY